MKSEEVIKNFYKTIKKEYNLSYLEVKEIVISPFIMIRYYISNMSLEDIRLIYIGKFKVLKGSVKKSLKFKKNLNEEDKKKLNNFLEKNKKK